MTSGSADATGSADGAADGVAEGAPLAVDATVADPSGVVPVSPPGRPFAFSKASS